MTKRETQAFCDRVRGMLIHLGTLVTGKETKAAIKQTIEELGELEDDIGLNDANCYSPEYDDEDGEKP